MVVRAELEKKAGEMEKNVKQLTRGFLTQVIKM